MSSEPLQVEQKGAVRHIVLNRPDQRNAQTKEMLDALDAAFAAALDDDAVRVVVLAGAGDHFSAGHDLKQAERERADFTVEERWAYESRRYYDLTLRIRDFAKPTIAQVQGACISGGFMLANVCDLIVAGESAFFADPVMHTLGAAATEVLIHPWVMNVRQAKELLFTGGRIDAQQALRIGMVNRVVPDARLNAETMALAARIAEAPPFGLMLTKRSLNRVADLQGQRASLAAHFDTHQLSHVSDGFATARRAGLAAAIDKGRP